MPYLSSTTANPACWGAPVRRVSGGDRDAMSRAVGALGTSDVEDAEVHDFCTGIELNRYEYLGFADRFDGHGSAGVEVIKVHPPGATGVAQCGELSAQQRRDATDQLDEARVTLAHNVGGPTAVAAVTTLEGPGRHGR